METHHPHIEITIQAKSNQIFFTVHVKHDAIANDRVSSRVDNLTMHCIFSCCPKTWQHWQEFVQNGSVVLINTLAVTNSYKITLQFTECNQLAQNARYSSASGPSN